MGKTLPKLVALFAAVALSLDAGAQVSRRIVGIVVEDDTTLPVIQAGVQLLSRADSTMIEGVVTDQEGKFSIPAAPGDYILKFSYVGYATQYRNVHQTISQEGLNLGTISMIPETIGLDAAVVAAKVEPVSIKEDTVVYNAAAFRVAEDASLDELLKKIPGLEIDASNAVTLHGREIKQLMVNGKRYFGGNVATGLKNMPAAMVESIKAYDRPSDMALISGVEDGEEEPVLDVTVKKSMMGAWQNTVNVGYGSSDRGVARINANKISKKNQETIIARVSNIAGKPAITSTSRNAIGTGAVGDAIYSEAGWTMAKDTTGKKIAAHIHYGNNDRLALYESRSESIQSTSTTFNNTNGLRDATAPVFKADYSWQYSPNKTTTWYIKPFIQVEYNASYFLGKGRSFNKNPYDVCDRPNDYLEEGDDGDDDIFKDIRVNRSLNTIVNSYSRYNANFIGTWSKTSKVKNKRRYSLRIYGQKYGNLTDQAAVYKTRYYRIKKNPDSLLVRSSYTEDNTYMDHWYFGGSWIEPLKKGWVFQFYALSEWHRYSREKSYFDLAAVDKTWEVPQSYDIRVVKKALPANYENGYSELFSSSGGTYSKFDESIVLSAIKNTKKFNYNLGVSIRPLMSVLKYPTDAGVQTVRLTDVVVAPNIVMKYRFTKSNQLTFGWKSWPTSPALTSLLPVTNGSNPLVITRGNPYLESPVKTQVNFAYNYSDIKKANSFVCNGFYDGTRGAVVNSTVYDPETGVRTTTPVNLDGNWRVSGSAAYNQSLRDNRFSFTNHCAGEYRNEVSNLYNSKKKADELNVMGRLMIKDRLEGCYRGDWLEMILNGGIEYTDESSKLRPEMSQQPITYIAGLSTEITFPWMMRFESDYCLTFQRGYSYEELNKNYHIWNMEISQPVMNKKATLRLCWYDILRSQDNLTRSFSASNRSISLYNGVSSYFLLRFIYRFKL